MRTLMVLGAFGIAVLAGPPAVARADDYIGATGGNYNVGANWSGGTVPVGVPAYIRNGATVTLNSTVGSPALLWVGGPSDPSGADGSTLHLLPGAQLPVSAGTLVVGETYSGRVVHSGGSLVVGSSAYGAIVGYGAAASTAHGSFVLQDGYVQWGGTGTNRVGYNSTTDPNFRTTGVFEMTGGTFRHEPTSLDRLYVGSGPGGTGVVNVRGGTWSANASIQVGDAGGGVGFINVSEDDPSVPTTIENTGSLNLGRGGRFVSGVGYDPSYQARGYYTQTGGSVAIGTSIVLGWGSGAMPGGHSYGELNLSGGTFICRSIPTDSTLGQSEVREGFAGLSEGVVNVSGGYFWIGGGRAIRVGVGATTGAVIAPGKGTVNVTGGQFIYEGAEPGEDAIMLGYGESTYSYGRINVLGGSFVSNNPVTLAMHDSCTGVMQIGKNAYVDVLMLEMNSDGSRVPQLIVDVTGSGHSKMHAVVATLGGSLEIRNYGWRPKEGDTFTIIEVDFTPTGVFGAIVSSITNGLQADPNDPNVTLPPFTGQSDPNDDYTLTFRGLTAGDANGDHKVNGGDLALMGGSWLQTGKGWAECNFNDDPSGKVEGGDLALMGGSWKWVLPTAPVPSAALPEPAAIGVLALGGAALIRRKR